MALMVLMVAWVPAMIVVALVAVARAQATMVTLVAPLQVAVGARAQAAVAVPMAALTAALITRAAMPEAPALLMRPTISPMPSAGRSKTMATLRRVAALEMGPAERGPRAAHVRWAHLRQKHGNRQLLRPHRAVVKSGAALQTGGQLVRPYLGVV